MLRFIQINFILSTLLYLTFLLLHPPVTPLSTLFAIAATISTSATLYLIFTLVLLPFFLSKALSHILLPLFFFTVNLLLLFDILLFKVWKFHINAMVINILTSPASWDSLYVSTFSIMIALLCIVALIIFEYWLYRYTQNKKALFKGKTIGLLFLLILVEKLSYGFADVYNRQEILTSAAPIPLYQPLTFIKFVEKHLGIHAVPKTGSKNTIQKNATVHYPLSPLKLKADSPTPDIFIFMFDAARASILSPEVSPHIQALSKDALVFESHYSGGDATRFGIFSFFYGLNATYWFNFLHAGKEPLLFEALKAKGYNIQIISSTSTQWPEFRQSVYCGVQEHIQDDFQGVPFEKDRQSTDAFIRWIEDVDTQKPLFSFVFLDAPHGYSYPASFDKFKPNIGGDGANYIAANKTQAQAFKNSYKNAVAYDDSLLGEMITAIKKRHLYHDSVLIFSSDHGEEFYEYGFLGHNSSFSKAQTNAPLIFKLPTNTHKTITKMTSHLDMPATLLTLLGCENDPKEYSCGTDLLSQDFTRSFNYIAKWNKNAIMTATHTYIYSNLPNEMFKNEIRENSTYKIVKKATGDQIEKKLFDVMEQNRRFLE